MKREFTFNAIVSGMILAMSATAAAQQGILEEIVVTAQKRSQSIQDVAGSISALGALQIETRGISNTEDLFQNIPGLNYSDFYGTNMITIRGIGLQVDTGVGEPGVATHIDGVYIPRTSMGPLDVLDLERVEVLRGPQGTLYGRNATGGVVNFVTKKPTEEFEGEVSVGTGSWDRVMTSAYVSGPLVGNTVLGRLSVSFNDQDGFIDNIAPGGEPDLGDRRDESIRGALRFLPSDALTIDFSVSHQRQEFDAISQNLDTNVGFVASAFGGVTLNTDKPNTAVLTSVGAGGERETTNVSFTVGWDINESVSFKSITGYLDHDNGPLMAIAGAALDIFSDDLILHGEPGGAKWTASSETVSQEFNFVGTAFDDRLDWIAGLYYLDEKFDNLIPPRFGRFYQFAQGAAFADPMAGLQFIGIDQFFNEDTESKAVFFDLTYSLTDSLRVNVGLRYAEDEKDIGQKREFLFENNTPADIPTILGFPVLAGQAARVPFCDADVAGPLGEAGRSGTDTSETLPKIRFEWDFTNDTLLYAQWQKGFKSGSTNIVACDDQFEPEEIVAYELGFKTTLLDGRVNLNGAAFRYNYDNLQVLQLEQLGAFVVNVPEAEITGGELELTWLASDMLSFDASVAISDGEVTEGGAPKVDSVALFDIILANPTLPFDQQFAMAERDIEGNPLPRNPELTISLGANLSFSTDAGDWGFRAEVYYSDETQYGLFENSILEADSYTVGNVFATYTTSSGSFEVRAFVKNVTDEDYLYNGIHSTLTGVTGSYAPPRHWGLEASYKF